MFVRICFLLLLVGCATAWPLRAQRHAAVFDHYSIADGLSQSSVHTIWQDHLGFMWFGTQDGLNKFDGYTFTAYKPDPLNPRSLPEKSIEQIMGDRQGNIWVATEGGGLSRFDRDTEQFTNFRYHPADTTALASDFVTALTEDHEGRLWVGTYGGGLHRYEAGTGTFTRFAAHPNDPALGENWIFTLHIDAMGTLWVGTEGDGLMSYDPARNTLVPAPDETTGVPLPEVIFDIHATPDGLLWLATPDGLVRYNPLLNDQITYRSTDETPAPISDDVVLALLHGADGHLWVGTENGLNHLDPETGFFVAYHPDPLIPQSLPDGVILSLFQDRGGILWVGTESGGVSRLAEEKGHFTNYFHDPRNPNSLNGSDIWAVVEDGPDALWVGTQQGGLNHLDLATGQARLYAHDPSDPNSPLPGVVSTLFRSAHAPRTLWIGMKGSGLSALDLATTRFTHYVADLDDPTALCSDFINTIAEDAEGNLWLGTDGDGLCRLDPSTQRFTPFIQPDPYYDFNRIFGIEIDETGQFWLSTMGGIARYHPATARFINHAPERGNPQALGTSFIFSIHEYPSGLFWAGTDNGLYRINVRTDSTVRFRRFAERDGLPNEVVYAVLSDSQGYLWISTNRGLSRFDPTTESFRNFDVRDGLPTYEFNQGAFHKGASGTLYFGGIEGLTRFDPTMVYENQHQPPIVITAFSKFDKVVHKDLPPGTHIRLRHAENFFAFEFAALDYSNPANNRYAYRMTPFDPDWIEAGPRRYAAYTNLNPGRYIFHVKGSNNDGVWNEAGLSLTVEILPPFWQTWWFRVMSLLTLGVVVGGGVWSWHQRRIRSVERTRDEKIAIQRHIADRLEAERLHFARELHDGPIQTLQFAGFQLKQVGESVEATAGKEQLARLRASLQQVTLTLRTICGDLRPPALVHFGLARAVQSHADRFLETHPDLTISLDLMQDGNTLPERGRLGLFRIFQEALNNVARHAGPCTVWVRLRLHEDHVVLEVEDSGQGFVMPDRWGALAAQRHYGLLGAAERAETLKGSLHVQSAPGYGTLVRVTAPLDAPVPLAPTSPPVDTDDPVP